MHSYSGIYVDSNILKNQVSWSRVPYWQDTEDELLRKRSFVIRECL